MMDDKFSNLDRAHSNPNSNADEVQHVGIATLMDAIEGVHFPIDKQKLMDEKGDQTINMTGDLPEKLRVVLLRTDADEFLSLTDLVQKIETAI